MRLLISSLAVILALMTGALAQSRNIDQLSAGVSPSGTEIVPVVQGADPAVRLTLNQIIQALVSISAGCGNSTGTGAIQVGSINSVLQEISTTNTAYPITSSNCGQVIYLQGASGTPSLPQAGSNGFPYGFPITLCNEGAGNEVITVTTGTIGGLSTYTLGGGTAANPTCAAFTSDGVSNWKPISGPGAAAAAAQSYSAKRTTFLGPITVPVRQATSTNDFLFSTSDYFVCAFNSGGSATEHMPTSPATGDTYLIKDCSGNAVANNITISPAAGLIDGASTLVLNLARQSVALTYTGWGWMTN